MTSAPNWNLEVVFEGGVTGPAFSAELTQLKAELEVLRERAGSLGGLEGNEDAWVTMLVDLAAIQDRMRSVSAFAHCHKAADTTSEAIRLAAMAARELWSELTMAWIPLNAGLLQADAAVFDGFVAREAMVPCEPQLRRIVDRAKIELKPELQELAVEMDREAVHAWGQLYDQISGKISARLHLPGQDAVDVSVGVLNTYRSNGDEAVRKAAFEAATEAWTGVEDLCAATLSNLTGARQSRCKRIGCDEVAHSFFDNRVTPPLVEAMWHAADHAQPKLIAYLDRKAKLLGKDKLDWWDLSAPVADSTDAGISWDESRELILDAFGGFSPQLRSFAIKAFDEQWIEAEKRAGKMQGGFCAGFVAERSSRIFMTWGDTLRSSMTLAHELGHAFHNDVILDAHPFRRSLTSCLAETASTFGEAVFRDHALQNASSDTTRLVMIDQQLQAGVSFLMNIRARYIFERELYTMRASGAFTAAQLTESMLRAQKSTYGDSLASWDSTFWTSKLHFYISHFGFYNWPYTFGYLFSGAVYQRFLDEGDAFTPHYIDLLRRTGWDSCVNIGHASLGADLEQPEFWINATGPLLRDVDTFLELTE